MLPPHTLNTANTLTIVRVLLVPVFVLLFINHFYTTALVVFITAGLTDAIDGFIARRFNQQTEFGTVMDPVADKLLMISSYLVLGIMGWLPAFLPPLVILRDVALLTGYMLIKSSGAELKVRPSILGKLTTVFQVSTAVYAMFLSGQINLLLTILIYGTVIFTVSSGLHYTYREIMILKKSSGE
ncbi:MAG: CDP-diacylglycerol--glycerol-3-phosphate 3-phosphatidyltransferase [Deltaproteobacteria bacterium]|nr:CDP-diacylglycerol--glycerol-3-phosphate 3-phosphatidyltransferase [Deltaproteobacteria bacterium]